MLGINGLITSAVASINCTTSSIILAVVCRNEEVRRLLEVRRKDRSDDSVVNCSGGAKMAHSLLGIINEESIFKFRARSLRSSCIGSTSLTSPIDIIGEGALSVNSILIMSYNFCISHSIWSLKLTAATSKACA